MSFEELPCRQDLTALSRKKKIQTTTFLVIFTVFPTFRFFSPAVDGAGDGESLKFEITFVA